MDEETRNALMAIDEELEAINKWSEKVMECIKSFGERLKILEDKKPE